MSNKLIVSVVIGKVSNLSPSAASLIGSIVLDDAVQQFSLSVPVTEASLVSFIQELFRKAQEAGLVEGPIDAAYIAGTLAAV